MGTPFHRGGGSIITLDGVTPDIASDAYIAEGARIIGDVTIGEQSSVWFNCVLRGDVNTIQVGARSNVQDGTVVHVSRKTHGTTIGDDVLIGHMAMIHGCELQDFAFVGLSAIVMDGCVIEPYGMLAAGALLPPGRVIKAKEMWVGRPARLVRMLSDEELAYHRKAAPGYAQLAAHYAEKAQ